MWFWILLATSLILLSALCVVIWYVKQVMKKLWFVSRNIGDLLIETRYFKEHLSMVYGLESYYGDETLEHLLTHVGGFLEQIEKFEEVYSIVDGELEIMEIIESEEGLVDEEDSEQEYKEE
tara:strand:- start:26993 stop:27355 length:363 start_codon:yes stop_codon:yes gene_type:complete